MIHSFSKQLPRRYVLPPKLLSDPLFRTHSSPQPLDYNMISDNDLYTLAIFIGTAAMLLIILYHYLEVNAVPQPAEDSKVAATSEPDAKAASLWR
jgi:oligosaccharyl transferase complex subunit OST4